jgi:superfamily II DNA helicase RecQ
MPFRKKRIFDIAESDIISSVETMWKFSPAKWQVRAIDQMLRGVDTIAISATGSGKSMPYMHMLKFLNLDKLSGAIILCISPVKALMHDQVSLHDLSFY